MLYGVRSQMSLCCITGGGGQESHIHCHHHHNRDNRDNHDNCHYLYLLREILHATVLSCKHLRGIIIVIVAITITIIIIMIMTIIMVISRGLF